MGGDGSPVQNPPRAVEPLVGALEDDSWEVRQAAALALGETKSPRAVEPLMGALEKKDLAIVAGAYAFFIMRGTPGTEAVLIEGLSYMAA
ncbi:MAG: HEAT repeat domain-containing protein [Anaerolineales bacterium]|nr:HEAT repeat domain-containing protein [Anaerolineales bacterium]